MTLLILLRLFLVSLCPCGFPLQDAERLLEQFDSNDIDKREEAEVALLKLRPTAAVEKAWKSADGELKERLARLLHKLDLLDLPELDADALKKRLDARDPDEQRRLWYELRTTLLTRETFGRIATEMIRRLPGQVDDPAEFAFLSSLHSRSAHIDAIDADVLAGLLRRHLDSENGDPACALTLAGDHPKAAIALADLIGARLRDEMYYALACETVRRSKLREAVPTLLKLIESGSEKRLDRYEEALAAVGSSDLMDDLLRIAKSGDGIVRRHYAIRLLGELGCDKAIPFLLEQLKGKSYGFSTVAAQALGMLKSRDAVAPILDRLLNDRAGNPPLMVDALAAIGDGAARAGLIKLVESKPKLRWCTLNAMARGWSKDFEPACLAALADEATEVRSAAQANLERFASASIVPELLKRRPNVEIILLLARFHAKEAAALLPGLLRESDLELVQAAMVLAVALGDGDSIPAIEKLLKAGLPPLALSAGDALLALGKQPDLAPVRMLLKSDQPMTRRGAVRLLLIAGDDSALEMLDEVDATDPSSHGKNVREYAALNGLRSRVGRRFFVSRWAEPQRPKTAEEGWKMVEERMGVKVSLPDVERRLPPPRFEPLERIADGLDGWLGGAGLTWIAEEDGTLRIVRDAEALDFWDKWLKERKK